MPKNLSSNAKYCISDETSEDDYDMNDESDTSSSFSLQECMKEFRARRVRRTPSTQHRQDPYNKASGKNIKGTAEIDLIYQNLCNKEQERMCKPCQNGFCYCFTSDSGDGDGTGEGCEVLGYLQAKNCRRSGRSECLKSKKERSSRDNQTPCFKNSIKTNRFTAICSIEESSVKAPLIHIIHELEENCVISKVKLNKTKLLTFEKAFCEKKNSKEKLIGAKLKAADIETNKYKPTAPNLESFTDLDTKTNKFKSKKGYESVEKQHNLAGKLLQKRQFTAQIIYEPKYMDEPPPKPPRVSVSAHDTFFSSDSTSSSVREAGRFLDNFLKMKLINSTEYTASNNDIKSLKSAEISKNTKQVKYDKKMCLIARNKTETAIKNIIPKYPIRKEFEEVIITKNGSLYEKDITPLTADINKMKDFGLNEKKKIDMINFDDDGKQEIFHTTFCQAQASHISSKGILKNENLIEMQITPKINLDTVDGVVHHNLASNFINKSTPVKEKIISPNQNFKKRSVGEKFLWSEQLKLLSPWSKKNNVNNNNYERNFRCRSKAFITSSKTKLLHLISPKKEQSNQKSFQMSKNSFRHFGVQTLPNDDFQTKANKINQHKSFLHSPPGSYHSPMQSSYMQYNSQNSSFKQYKNSIYNKNYPADFDFTRTVHSPTTKIFRASQRKLQFPLNCSVGHKKETCQSISTLNPLEESEKITYRSFNSELDQDVPITKINFVLNNIRSRLEVNDHQAVRTFQETHNIDQNVTGFDCPDNHKYGNALKSRENNLSEPIYSEIEDKRIYLSEGPDFCHCTDIQHYGAAGNPDILYTKINKLDKKGSILQAIPLGKIMMDSLEIKKNICPLGTLPEPTAAETNPISIALSSTSSISHSQSFNNIRLIKHNTSPNQQRKLSKSDLSLQRSELFLENLFKSELVVNPDFGGKIIKKKQNNKKNSSTQSTDAVSYELPNDEIDDSENAASDLGLITIGSLSPQYQSTPEKHYITSKDKPIMIESNTGDAEYCDFFSQSSMCIPEQKNLSHSLNVDKESNYESFEKSTIRNDLVKKRYNSFKKMLRKSFRKSKIFVSENVAEFIPNTTAGKQSYTKSNLNHNALFFNDSVNVGEQIAQAVSICRQLPDLENSIEMVEAERLLLFSALRRENHKTLSPIIRQKISKNQKALMSFFIDEMYLPVLGDVDQDICFNFFYIVTFECGGVIRSSQSAKCDNGVAVFRDMGIEFDFYSEMDAYNLQDMKQNAVKCNIFMLRLRKISTVSFEKKKKEKMEYFDPNSPSTTPTSTSSIFSATSDDIVSRFRLQASFVLDAKDFLPYEYVQEESNNCDRICIRSSCFCSLPLTSKTKSTNLSGKIRLVGRAEIRAPKLSYYGFLNVQDPNKQHNWNRRYCTLDNIFLHVWQDKSSFNISPLISIDLRNFRHKTYPLTCSPRELCARPRSFYLDYELKTTSETDSSSAVFFSADTQTTLDYWLKNLNIVLDFILTWLK